MFACLRYVFAYDWRLVYLYLSVVVKRIVGVRWFCVSYLLTNDDNVQKYDVRFCYLGGHDLHKREKFLAVRSIIRSDAIGFRCAEYGANCRLLYANGVRLLEESTSRLCTCPRQFNVTSDVRNVLRQQRRPVTTSTATTKTTHITTTSQQLQSYKIVEHWPAGSVQWCSFTATTTTTTSTTVLLLQQMLLQQRRSASEWAYFRHIATPQCHGVAPDDAQSKIRRNLH